MNYQNIAKNIGSTKTTQSPEESIKPSQHESGYAEPNLDSKPVNETRVVLAPIDGEKLIFNGFDILGNFRVYTIDRYRVTSSEQIAETKKVRSHRPSRM